MTSAYSGQRGPQRDRRIILEVLREEVGDRLFADFVIDLLSENGPTVAVESYRALWPCYALRRRSRARREG